MKIIIKKILLIYISLVLIFAPSSIVYAASPSGWAFNSFNVATSVVTAIKGGASASVAVAKSPISQKIAKGIVGGVIAGAALPLAISQITGIALSAIDWVIDGSQIKYKNPNPTVQPPGTYVFTASLTSNDLKNPKFAGAYALTRSIALCSNASLLYPKLLGVTASSFTTTGGGFGQGECIFPSGQKVAFIHAQVPDTGATTDEYKYIPISTVADKIYDNAKTDSASASIVNDAVKEYVNEGSADTALDAAKADADATHNCGTGTSWNGSACVATPDTPTDTPFDPTDIIDAIRKVFDAVMSLPDVINNALDSLLADIKDFFQPVLDKVTDIIDWVKQEPPQDEAPRNVPVGQLSDVGLENQDRFQARIKFPSQCPSQQLTFNYFGRTYSHEIPFQALCQVLEMVAPIFVGVACLGVAFYIVREV